MTAVIAWGGGVAFVASLAYFAYTYAITLGSPAASARVSPAAAVAIDILLFAAFATHHSLFIREPAKRWIARLVPPPLRRSVFVWMASVLLVVTCAAWQPLPGSLYHHTGVLAVLHLAVVALGVGLTALGARLLDPLQLAGIDQALGVAAQPAMGEPLVTRFPYSVVRHPIYLGWVLVVFGVPEMTWSRFLMACLSTAYLVVAVPWEERVLAATFGAAYEAYCRRVRWRILPFVY